MRCSMLRRFAEHVALEERMRGLADLVLRLQPDVLMFQVRPALPCASRPCASRPCASRPCCGAGALRSEALACGRRAFLTCLALLLRREKQLLLGLVRRACSRCWAQEVTHNMVRLWFEQHSWLADVYSFSQPPNDGSQ